MIRFLSLCLIAALAWAQSLQQGMRLFRERKFPEAAAALEPYVNLHPQEREARYMLALAWQQANNLPNAQRHLLELIRFHPKWAPGHFALARLYFVSGRFADAATWAGSALKLGEPEARVYHLLGAIEEERGLLEAALEAYSKAGAEDKRAAVLYKMGRYEDAKAAVAKALRSNPSDPEAQRLQQQLARVARPGVPVTKTAPAAFERIPLPFRLEHNPKPEKYLVSTMAGGIAVFDYDNDGRLDLFFTNGAELPSLRKTSPKFHNRLYRNLGDFRFEDVTQAAGLEGEGFSIGAAVGDFDGDGWQDLFVAGAGRNLLYRNNKGRFVPVPGAIKDEKLSVGAAWLDYDRDGRLDLFLVNYLDWTAPNPKFCGDASRKIRVYCHPREYKGMANRLYRNLGDGRFADVSKETGIASHIGKGMSAAVADYDGDGWPDIFVTNDVEPNFLFHNEQGRRFSEQALPLGVALTAEGVPVSAMGTEFADYDNDGRPDILFTALTGETFPLFRNTPAGFEDATYPSKLGIATARRSGWGVALADLNNDGWKDMATANSHVTDNIEELRAERYREPNLVVMNQGGQFGQPVELGPAAPHRGLVAADLDGDGKLDLVTSVLEGNAIIWRNVTPGAGNWVAVHAPIGSTIRVGRQVQQAFTSHGYVSSVAAPLHFGIGADSTADIEVRFADGARTKLPAVKAGSIVRASRE